MEPRIQYAKTTDGVSIAYSAIGDGSPLVLTPLIPSHIGLLWQAPYFRRVWERLAQRRRVIYYDSRGNGLSQRNITDFSLDAHVLDLEAVVDRLQLQKFALMGVAHTGPAAIAYAARHPDRVTHLVLWHSWARTSEIGGLELTDGTGSLIDRDWSAYAEMIGFLWFGLSEAEQAQRAATLVRESTTPQELKAAYDEIGRIDVSDLLPELKRPTLVLYPREARSPQMDVARRLASEIPDARLAVFEGRLLAINAETLEAVGASIDEFLGEGEPAAAPPVAAPPEAGAFRTVLFTDVVGHAEMMSRLGDERGRAILREHERITREVLKAHGGTEVKTMGDGFMASFGSVTKAVECAIALQRAFAEWNASHSAHPERAGGAVEGGAETRPSTGSGRAEEIRIRIGLNAGEPIEEEGDLFGAAVILAARIAAQAQGGEILASLAVRELCAGKGFLFADTGEVTLKGFEEPVRLFAVRWREEG